MEADLATWVLGTGRHHPRSYGTYSRLLEKFVRVEKVLTLEEGVRRMTSLPVQRLGMRDRGLLRVGARADLVVFDPGAIRDRATLSDPYRYPEGISCVVVSGQVSVNDGQSTGARAGELLRRE